jgi:hypothetical protein
MSRRVGKPRRALPMALAVNPRDMRVLAGIPTAAVGAIGNPRAEATRRSLAEDRLDQGDDPPPLPLPPPPPAPPLPPPPPLPPAIPVSPGQIVLADDYLCGLCQHSLIGHDEDGEGEGESIVGLCCTDPITHVFHGSCLADWRASPLRDLAELCPSCNVDPKQAISRRAASQAIKARIKRRRDSCWRTFYAEWARQRSIVTFIMLAVGMTLVIVQVLQDWFQSWSR